MPEYITSGNVTAQEITNLVKYVTPSGDFKRAQALGIVLTSATHEPTTTLGEIIKANPKLAPEIRFVEETRECGTHTVEYDHPPFVDPEVKATFGKSLLHRAACFDSCWFAVDGQGRSTCVMAQDTSRYIAMEALGMSIYPVIIKSSSQTYWDYRRGVQREMADKSFKFGDRNTFDPNLLNDRETKGKLRERIADMIFAGVLPLPMNEDEAINSLTVSELACGQIYTHLKFEIERENKQKDILVSTFPIGPVGSVPDRVLREDVNALVNLGNELIQFPSLAQKIRVNVPNFMGILDGTHNSYTFYTSPLIKGINSLSIYEKNRNLSLIGYDYTNLNSKVYDMGKGGIQSILDTCCLIWMLGKGNFSRDFSLDAGDIALIVDNNNTQFAWMTYRNGTTKMSRKEFINAMKSNKCMVDDGNNGNKNIEPFNHLDIGKSIDRLQANLRLPVIR
jgi:hypothetical protein